MIKAILVDDEIRVLQAIEKNVNWKACGIDYLLTAGDVDAARGLIRKYQPDLLLTDIEMPDGSGLELIEEVLKEWPQVKCICISCHPEFAYLRKAMQLGSVDYILKPVEYAELEMILKKTVQGIQNSRYGEASSGELSANPEVGYYEEDRFMEQAKEYIEQHLLEDISIGKLADSIGSSSSHVMRTFKKRLNMTVIEYVTSQRLEKAKQLLSNTDLPIMTVAEFSGYADYSYFTRVFKKETGVTPREYRNNSKPAK
ncbi:MAG: helix-turn-helix domain-containing protein [Blautia sp.]|nr:helix-turn-helix domain-containing protein [Blautia sp.]